MSISRGGHDVWTALVRRGRRSCRAFSLIELIVVIGVVLTLISLVVAGVFRSQSNAMQSVNLSNLRNHAQAMTLYVNDAAGVFPLFLPQGSLIHSLQGGGVTSRGLSYFDMHQTWHIALADRYLAGNARQAWLYPPGSGPSTSGAAVSVPGGTAYHYPCVFVAKREYWNEETRTGPAQFGAVGMSAVQFPSVKTIMVDSFGVRPRKEATSAAMVDGSASAIPNEKTANGYERGDGYQFRNDGAVHFNDRLRLVHTLGGAGGRDRRP